MSKTSATTHAGHSTRPTKPSLRYEPKPKGSWRKLIGRAKNDDLSLEAFQLGAEWRDQMNRTRR